MHKKVDVVKTEEDGDIEIFSQDEFEYMPPLSSLHEAVDLYNTQKEGDGE